MFTTSLLFQPRFLTRLAGFFQGFRDGIDSSSELNPMLYNMRYESYNVYTITERKKKMQKISENHRKSSSQDFGQNFEESKERIEKTFFAISRYVVGIA